MIAAALLLGLAACEDTLVPFVDGGVGRRLEILDPPGSQIGLRFSRSLDLAVRYVSDDVAAQAIRNEPVHFAIFDDPVGSTLSRDTVSSDDEGLAVVTLNGGTQEGSFRVRASASGAADVEFAISISELEFVEIDAKIEDPLPNTGERALYAALYVDKTCAELGPAPKMLGAARTLSKSPAKSATLAFVNLLSRSYAVVGRVEDAGRLVAYGCLDIDRALAPPGAHLSLPLPMSALAPAVVGGFDLITQLGSKRSERSDALFADFDVVERCDGHLGQLLLDELIARLSVARAAQASAHRGPSAPMSVGQSTVSCRPGKLAAIDTLDAELNALVSTGPNGVARAALWTDLDAILASAVMSSHLTLRPTAANARDDASSPQRLLATHEAGTITLSLGSATRAYDLAALGRPVFAAIGVEALRETDKLVLSSHDLPVGLPQLWSASWDELAIATRLPALTDATVGGWVHACAGEAQRNAKLGCAAIEDLLCERTDPSGCAGTLITACTQAVAAVADRLAGVSAKAFTLSLQGSARIVDDDGDLVGERLDGGTWVATGTLSQGLAFSGQRSTP